MVLHRPGDQRGGLAGVRVCGLGGGGGVVSELRIHAQRDPWRGSIDLAILHRSGDRVSAGELILRELPDGGYADPTCRLEPGAAQALMDELWRLGIRPADGTGSTGQLAATERHLADMRGIALASLRAKGIKA